MNAHLSHRLAQGDMLILNSRIRHTRLGPLVHAFSYCADYILFCPERVTKSQGLLARNRWGLFSLHDLDSGGPRGAGQGAAWAWQQFSRVGLTRSSDMVLGLLTQPRMLGLVFNPVSFWLLWRGEDLIAMLAEVNNTFGQRHSYICHNPDFSPITAATPLFCDKIFHVSPFQDVTGEYLFRLGISSENVAILIRYQGPQSGLVARMQAAPRPLRQTALLRMALTRPGGALRILTLIFFEALRLKLRGAAYRPLPPAPVKDVSP